MLDEFYLGVDYGHKKTGLAIAQNIIKKSRPLKVLYNDYILEINKVLDEWNITKIIIGYPYHAKESKIHDDIKSFIEELKSAVSSSIEIIIHDEQLSSESA
ncbi:MAG: RuvX/YqgF family protein, partial [Gammaproteobacteria bacterium]